MAMIFLIQISLWGQNRVVYTEVTADTIPFGSHFEIRYIAENIKVNFEAPVFDNLKVLSGPNIASNMQYVNGTMSSRVSYSFTLKPIEIGEVIIPPAYFVAPDTTIETIPIPILTIPDTGDIKIDNKSFKRIDATDVKVVEKKPSKKRKRKKIKL